MRTQKQSDLRGYREIRMRLDAATAEGTGMFLTERGVRLIRALLPETGQKLTKVKRRGS
jgi:hypothetical protein